VDTFLAWTFLGPTVLLTDLRLRHIHEKHPEVVEEGADRIADFLRRPECVRKSARDANVVLLSRWYDEFLMGKHLVVVVAMPGRTGGGPRVLTAYVTRDLGPGEVLWPTS